LSPTRSQIFVTHKIPNALDHEFAIDAGQGASLSIKTQEDIPSSSIPKTAIINTPRSAYFGSSAAKESRRRLNESISKEAAEEACGD
jgi:hypothetical protein